MQLTKYIKLLALVLGVTLFASCQDYLDINKDPNSVTDVPIEQLLTSATTTIGFFAGSDLHRYGALLAQQFSGQGSGATTQPQEYDRYNIQGSDLNNLWNLIYATILSDLEVIVQKANTENSPHYAGVAKILKVYMFHLVVDTWGKAPYSQALKFAENSSPAYDEGEVIYRDLLTQLDQAIADLNAASAKTPGSNSTIYADNFENWEKLANTLKLRLYIHQSKKNRSDVVSKINSMISSGAKFFESNADNFEMLFYDATGSQNAIHQFELSRANQFFPANTLVNIMNGKNDPRRAFYFTPFPFTRSNPQYKGATAGDDPSFKYSRMHIYLRGDTTNSLPAEGEADGSIVAGAYSYSGAAPARMLTFAEYNFIRAEAALYGSTGDAQTFFQAGIRASMEAAGVASADVDAYIAANGTLAGTEQEKLRQIIEEKYVANYGVVLEPWSDWRRTGIPSLTLPVNALVPYTPRSMYYAQSEIDLNSNAPDQKAGLDERVFWDVQ